jgi:hypothetical protein
MILVLFSILVVVAIGVYGLLKEEIMSLSRKIISPENASQVILEGDTPAVASASSPMDIPQGQIVYQKVGADGEPISGLVVTSPTGTKLRNINMPSLIFSHFPIQTQQRALVYNSDQKYYLLNLESNAAIEIRFPLDQIVLPANSTQVQGGGKQSVLFGNNQTRRLIFMVNLLSGDVFDLRTLSEDFIYGAFTPDEDKLLLFSDSLWLIPTSDPKSASRLSLCDSQL